MTQTSFKTDGAKLTLYADGPEWDAVPTAALGGFSCATVDAGRKVLAEVVEFAQSQGIRRLLGPMDGDTWHSYRFVIESDDSPPFLLEPQNPPHAPEVFTASGFDLISSYFSARVSLDQHATDTPPESADFTIETWNGEDPETLFGQVYELSVEAFSNNAFYKPISREAFLAMYMPIVPMIRRELIFFARHQDGSLAGFLFGIPNYAEGNAPQSVLLKTYASLSRGAGRHLSHAFHYAAKTAGFQTAIHALIHDDNLSALRSAVEGATVFRRYGLFGLRLDAHPDG